MRAYLLFCERLLIIILIFFLPWQFQVKASDQAVPEKTAVSSVYIQVKRDMRKPIFESAPYTTTVRESNPVGKTIFQLRGRDDDVMVSLFITTLFFQNNKKENIKEYHCII